MIGGKVDGQILFGARSEKPKILFDAMGNKRKNLFGAKWQLRKNLFGSQRVNMLSQTLYLSFPASAYQGALTKSAYLLASNINFR